MQSCAYKMASAKQSACDFITNGTHLLMGQLKNLDVVVKALRRRGVISKDESVVKHHSDQTDSSATKMLLDNIIAKGEGACYQLLKILDEERFKIFPRPNSVKPDLHYWISCFSFQEDSQIQSNQKTGPCARYQTQLRKKAEQILNDKWNRTIHFLKDEIKRNFRYIPVVLDTDDSTFSKLKSKAYKKSRSKKLKTYIPTDRKKLSPDHLLKNDEKSILLVGKPGIGKTTVALEILRLWSEGEDSQVNYMFYFNEPFMRTISHSRSPQTLENLLFGMYLQPEEGADEVLEDIEANSENVVIVFDGIMDVIGNSVIKQIMKKELLRDAKIFTTCRPEAEASGYLSNWPSYRVEVQGFNEKSIHAFFKWMLGMDDDTSISALSHPEVFSLCHVPMYAFIVTACISFSPSESSNQPYTITEMYVRIFRYCMKQHGDQSVEHLDKYIHDSKGDIMFLAATSYQALLAKTVNMAGLDHKDKSVQCAFLTSTTSKDPTFASQTVSSFLHNTMQEFWAALFLLMNPDNITHVLQQCQTEDGKYLKYVMSFLCGLLSDKIVKLIKCLVEEKKVKAIAAEYFAEIIHTFQQIPVEEDDVEAEDLLFVCQCLYEYQSPEACLLFLSKVDNEIDLSDETLDPHQCCAVSYIINQSDKQDVNLDLMDSSVSDPGLKLILGCLSRLKCLRVTSKMRCDLWRVAFQATGPVTDFDSLLRLLGFEMHLLVQDHDDQDVLRRAGDILSKKRAEKVHCHLHLNTKHSPKSLQEMIYVHLPSMASIRFVSTDSQTNALVTFWLDLLLQGAVYEKKTGKKCLQHLVSELTRNQLHGFEEELQFLRTLYSHGRSRGYFSVLQSVFQTMTSSWAIRLSDPNLSLLLEILKIYNMKKPLELCLLDEKMDHKNFFLHLPYVSQLRFNRSDLKQANGSHKAIKIVADLFTHAFENGEETLKILSSACSYSTFPFAVDSKDLQSPFLLDLFSYIRDTEKGEFILPAMQPVFQHAPQVWVVDLTKGKASALLRMFEFLSEKKTVELTDWSFDQQELKIFLQCLPFVSQLRCDDEFFQSVCEVLSADRDWNPEQVSWLLRPLDFTVTLTGMLPSRICGAINTVLSQLNPKENLSVNLYPLRMSCRGAGVLFSKVQRLRKLRVNENAAVKLARLARSKKIPHVMTIEQLSLNLANQNPPAEQQLGRLLSSLASLLRTWTVRSLDLTEHQTEDHLLLGLLCHEDSWSVSFKLSENDLKQLAEVVYEAQDDVLTHLFLEKIGHDLSPCLLPWNVLQYLLQAANKPVTLDLNQSKFNVQNIQVLLGLLDKTIFRRVSSKFVRAALREIYEQRAGHFVIPMVRSSGNWIDLHQTKLDTWDCEALRFALHYSDDVKLNLHSSVIPKEKTGMILTLLSRVSELRVDRKLLLTLLHACLESNEKQALSSDLLRSLHYTLDFSSASAVQLNKDNREPLRLSLMDCKAIAAAIKISGCDTELVLYDCKADDSALEELFPILHGVHLRLGKRFLLQLLSLIHEETPLRWVVSLSKALGKEVDLSHIPMDHQTCQSLRLILEQLEELSQLNLSHCQLNDDCLALLSPHLHKVMGLNLSSNDITDKGVRELYEVLGSTTFTQTVCLFNNIITDPGIVLRDKRFKTSCMGTQPLDQSQDQDTNNLESLDVMKAMVVQFSKKSDPVKEFDPDIRVQGQRIYYRFQCNAEGKFQCRATGLVFCMTGRGYIQYNTVHWDMQILSNTLYEPAGPLFDIKAKGEGQMYQLHLPHCEAEVDAVGHLSVVHVSKNTKRQFLTPIKVTNTHVVISISGLSQFGAVHDNKEESTSQEKTAVRKRHPSGRKHHGQILLFLEPDIPVDEQRLWVFLVSSNVPLLEIQEQQKEYKFIKTSSSCILRSMAEYSLFSEAAICVQPEEYQFNPSHNGNHHASFEAFFKNNETKVQLKIHETLKKAEINEGKTKLVWSRLVVLKTKQETCVKHENFLQTDGNRCDLTVEQWKNTLGSLLDELDDKQIKKLKFLMCNPNTVDLISIPKSESEKKERYELVDIMVERWGFKQSVRATRDFMRKIPRNDPAVVDKLKPYLTQFSLEH